MGSESIRMIGVVGAGQMGSGIAHVAAASGLRVIMMDSAPGALEKATTTIGRNMQRQVDKGTLSAGDREAALGLVKTCADLKPFAECDFVVEAVSENLSLKVKIFQELDATCRKGVILATNTSSLPITRVAAATGRQPEVIGMHFMNPVPIMKLVEIVSGQGTSSGTVAVTRDLAVRMGKTPVVAQDYPGFISNRVLMPMINEAIYTLYEGVGSRDDIDTVMKLGMNHPMGPLTLADFIGLDTCLSILEILHDGFGDPKYRPCPLLRRMVDAGQLGRKAGRGFYDYTAEAKK
jgi:3-hydroxybutyryl-CoA dehydrogenase